MHYYFYSWLFFYRLKFSRFFILSCQVSVSLQSIKRIHLSIYLFFHLGICVCCVCVLFIAEINIYVEIYFLLVRFYSFFTYSIIYLEQADTRIVWSFKGMVCFHKASNKALHHPLLTTRFFTKHCVVYLDEWNEHVALLFSTSELCSDFCLSMVPNTSILQQMQVSNAMSHLAMCVKLPNLRSFCCAMKVFQVRQFMFTVGNP